MGKNYVPERLNSILEQGPAVLSLTPDPEAFFQSRQQFQIILNRVELLVEDLNVDPKPSPETIKKYLEAILASMEEYAKFLRDLQKNAEGQERKKLAE